MKSKRLGAVDAGEGGPADREEGDMTQTLPEGKELLDSEDIANYLGVSQTTVWRWCREGELPCMKIARG